MIDLYYILINWLNISKIIKKKANLYLDDKLVNNFDDLLEKGYNIVLNKKHQRDVLKEEEDYLQGEIISVEREIIP